MGGCLSVGASLEVTPVPERQAGATVSVVELCPVGDLEGVEIVHKPPAGSQTCGRLGLLIPNVLANPRVHALFILAVGHKGRIGSGHWKTVVDEGLILQVSRPLADPPKVVGVGPVLRSRDQISFHGVQVDVAAQMNEVFFFVDPFVTKTYLKQRTCASLLAIHGLDVGVEEDVYESG